MQEAWLAAALGWAACVQMLGPAYLLQFRYNSTSIVQ
jgi:hypothetical protein